MKFLVAAIFFLVPLLQASATSPECIEAFIRLFDRDMAAPMKFAVFEPRFAILDGSPSEQLQAHENAIRRRAAPVYAAEIRKELAKLVDETCAGGECNLEIREALVVFQVWKIKGPGQRNFTQVSPAELLEVKAVLNSPAHQRPSFLSTEEWASFQDKLRQFRKLPLAKGSTGGKERLETFIASDLFNFRPKETCCGSGKCNNCPVDFILSIKAQALRSQEVSAQFNLQQHDSAAKVAPSVFALAESLRRTVNEESEIAQSALSPAIAETFYTLVESSLIRHRHLPISPKEISEMVRALRTSDSSYLERAPAQASAAVTTLIEWAIDQQNAVSSDLGKIQSAIATELTLASPQQRSLFAEAWQKSLQRRGLQGFPLF